LVDVKKEIPQVNRLLPTALIPGANTMVNSVYPSGTITFTFEKTTLTVRYNRAMVNWKRDNASPHERKVDHDPM